MSGIAWLQLAVVVLSGAVVTMAVVVTMVRKQVNALEEHLNALLTVLLLGLGGGDRHE
jgi:hypothetical protein